MKLLKFLSGLARADSGDILFDGKNIRKIDKDTQTEIMEIFRNLARQGKCVILVSHAGDVAAMCDEYYELTRLPKKSS